MVTEYGMSETLGLVTYQKERKPMFLDSGFFPSREYSKGTAEKIDGEVALLMSEAHDRVHMLLTEKKDGLEVIAKALLEKETLLGEELKMRW
jgi:cell division protease FtsH